MLQQPSRLAKARKSAPPRGRRRQQRAGPVGSTTQRRPQSDAACANQHSGQCGGVTTVVCAAAACATIVPRESCLFQCVLQRGRPASRGEISSGTVLGARCATNGTH